MITNDVPLNMITHIPAYYMDKVFEIWQHKATADEIRQSDTHTNPLTMEHRNSIQDMTADRDLRQLRQD